VIAPEGERAKEHEGGVDVEQQCGQRRVDTRERSEVAT
jgi:hypothetical protein